MTVDEAQDARELRAFLPVRDVDGDPLGLLIGGGWESRSNSAEEAARRALREFASLEPSSDVALDVEAASSGLSLDKGGALAADAFEVKA